MLVCSLVEQSAEGCLLNQQTNQQASLYFVSLLPLQFWRSRVRLIKREISGTDGLISVD